ncbi:trypsin-1-like [Penaeus monodon]|uniref:trypsin-1-like n=1 Tax=Penaeus monodon TaxID=6687 RepID=UPI0018A7D312|nr:trypsin-1-like [Penaeus monodon]
MRLLLLCLWLSGALAGPSLRPTFRRGLNRIVGGTEAAPGEIPYQLSFQDISYDEVFHFCGASIYNENWGICAGHCVSGEDWDNPDYLQVVAGEHNLKVDEGTEQTRILSKIIRHDDFNGPWLYNDISLLQFSSPLTFDDYVQPIPIAEQGHTATGDCVVSGWGTTVEGGYSPDVLQKVTVPIVPDEECAQHLLIENFMICAGYPDGGSDACQGDSGGPLVCKDTGSPYLAGIVSWGYGCARPETPGVYTEVSYFSDWIKMHTGT